MYNNAKYLGNTLINEILKIIKIYCSKKIQSTATYKPTRTETDSYTQAIQVVGCADPSGSWWGNNDQIILLHHITT